MKEYSVLIIDNETGEVLMDKKTKVLKINETFDNLRVMTGPPEKVIIENVGSFVTISGYFPKNKSKSKK